MKIKIKKIIFFLLGAIFTFFLGAILEYYCGSFVKRIDVFVFGEPKINFNLAEYRLANNLNEFKDFNLFFSTSHGKSTTFFVQIGEEDLNKEYGDLLFLKDSDKLQDRISRSFALMNSGTRKAENIKIKIMSATKISDSDITFLEEKDRKIKCGGFADNYFCEVIITKLEKGEKTSFATLEPGIKNIECTISGLSTCKENYRYFYAKDSTGYNLLELEPGKTDTCLNSGKIELPPTNIENNYLVYYYIKDESRWNILYQE